MKTVVMNDHCERACRAAKKSGMNHRHGAVVIYNGEIIAEGYNRECNEFKELFSVHAEVDALMKVRKMGKHILSQCDLVVVRIGPSTLENAMKLSMPCSKCKPFIERLGIRRVYYSTNEEYDRMLRQHEKYAHMSETILQMRDNSAHAHTSTRRLRSDLDDCIDEHNDTKSRSPRHGRARRVVDLSRQSQECLRRQCKSA